MTVTGACFLPFYIDMGFQPGKTLHSDWVLRSWLRINNTLVMKKKKRKINLAGLRFAFKAGDDRMLGIIAGLMISVLRRSGRLLIDLY